MICIDSDFIIAILKDEPKARDLLMEIESQGDVYTTSINLFEILYTSRGMSKIRENALISLLDALKILPLDRKSALLASGIGNKLVKKGKMVQQMDLMIGAIALQNDMVLVTKNRKHFSRIPGLRTMSW